MDDKFFTNTHTHLHTYANLLCDTCLEGRVSHANETDPASSRQRTDVLHHITTKTEVIFTFITCHRHSDGEKMCNLPFSHTLQKNEKPFPLSVFASWIKKIWRKYKFPISCLSFHCHTTIEEKPTGEVTECGLILMRNVICQRVSIGCEVQGCHGDLDSATPRSLSLL